MNPNVKPSDQAVVAAVISPQNAAAGTVASTWVSLADYDAIQAIVAVGTLGASATVDAKLEQAQDSAGTGVKNITGKAITQFTKAGADDNKQAIINCRSDELDVANNYTHVRVLVTVGSAASDIAAFILGHDARYQPGTPVTSVAETIV